MQCSTIRSRDVSAVEETWRQVTPNARLQPIDQQKFRYEWQSMTSGALTVVDYELTAHVRSAVDPTDQFFTCRVATDHGRVGTDRREFDARQAWTHAGRQVTAEWDGTARVRALVFDLKHAQAVARRISGNDALVLRATDASPASPALASYWDCVYDHVRQTLLAEGSEHSLIEAQLRWYALHAVLSIFPTTLQDALERPAQSAPANATIRRAKLFMDEHAHEPVTVDDVAAAVHVSTRSLQYAFKRATGESPMEYLRRVRLAGAHDELTRSEHALVAEVAAKWGFAHRSRFAKYYRDQYGRNPSDALARPA